MKYILDGREVAQAVFEYIGRHYVDPKGRKMNISVTLTADKTLLGTPKFEAEVILEEET